MNTTIALAQAPRMPLMSDAKQNASPEITPTVFVVDDDVSVRESLEALIAGAELERSIALVTVRFEADIAAVTRNAAGEVVAGSLSDAVQTRDRWTFRQALPTCGTMGTSPPNGPRS